VSISDKQAHLNPISNNCPLSLGNESQEITDAQGKGTTIMVLQKKNHCDTIQEIQDHDNIKKDSSFFVVKTTKEDSNDRVRQDNRPSQNDIMNQEDTDHLASLAKCQAAPFHLMNLGMTMAKTPRTVKANT
jgi:hypothetical protein